MAQSNIIIENKPGEENAIEFMNENAKPAANILKKYLDKSFSNPFIIQGSSENNGKLKAAIHLEITNSKNKKEKNSFSIKSDDTTIFLAAANENVLSEYKTVESIKSLYNTLQTDRADNQIWKWFVIFALLFLITEMTIIRFVK